MEIIQPKVWNKFSKFEQYTPVKGWSVFQDRGQGGGRAPGRYRRPRHPQRYRGGS